MVSSAATLISKKDLFVKAPKEDDHDPQADLLILTNGRRGETKIVDSPPYANGKQPDDHDHDITHVPNNIPGWASTLFKD
ncbi:hypothetical protein TIFTF001_015051 [Ficus carica]|uniref:Uncharacterized protein n=1 Tax=Ficus carica TaxID=3494 RepID=A0AA88DIK2_FICCA|nr:hypothetical protein TIFTF001_015051 [Ficus carica]